QALGDPLGPVAPPAGAEGERNRDHLRPPAASYAIETPDQILEQMVREPFPDDQLQECARPCEMGRPSSKQLHRTRAQFVAPSFGIELLLGSRCLFEVLVDVDHDVTDLAHRRTSPNRGTHAVLWRAGSWRRAWADRGCV